MHHIELVVAGEDLLISLATGAIVLFLHHLGIVLQDVGQSFWREDILPQVVGLDAVRVGRIACAVVVAFVEGQEPGVVAFEVSAHLYGLVVHGEVHCAAAELEEKLSWISIPFVLLHCVLNGLFGQAVLQLEGGHRQAVYEQAKVEGALSLVFAVVQLPGNAEDIGSEELCCHFISGRRSAVEKVNLGRAVMDAIS